MEPQPALVGAQGAVELDPEAPVDLHLAVVVLPGNAEDRLPLGLADPLDDLGLGEFGVLHQHGGDGLEHFLDRLVELRLAGVPLDHILENHFHAFR